MSEVEASFKRMIWNTASKNIGRELIRQGRLSDFVEWRFWGFPSLETIHHDLPLQFFHTDDGEQSKELVRHIEDTGEPDIIWAEGLDFPPLLERIFELCPNSRKIIYSKYTDPCLIKNLETYDLCLIDEEWQADEIRRRFPRVRTGLWDKLIEYDTTFRPVPTDKKFDICYVARLHPRKNHWLLYDALSRIRDRNLTVVLVGSDQWDLQQYLEPLSRDAGVETEFTGELPANDVNLVINQSRLGVVCDQFDAVPRAMLEYMAADIPVLVNEEMRAGTRYVGIGAGLVRPPEGFHRGVTEILDRLDDYRPRDHLIEFYSREKVVEKFWAILGEALT